MAHIWLENVNVEFAIHNAASRSLRHELYRAVGGDIKKHYRAVTVQALKGVTIDLKEGDRLALMGHNGAGKTTLLRVMAGVYPPTSGAIDVVGRRAALTDITMGMDSEMTGYDNIIARLVFMGASFRRAQELVPEVVEFCELGDYLNLPARTYSSGMFMRLAFAIATSVAPEILILDEMLSAGDAHFIEKAKKRTLEFVNQTKIMVLASHDLSMLRAYCNRAIWMNHGEAHHYDDIEKAWHDYTTAPR